MEFHLERDQMTHAVLSPVPPPTHTLSNMSWTSLMSVPVDPPHRLHACVVCPDRLVHVSALLPFPLSPSPQSMEIEVFPIVLLIRIPTVNVCRLISAYFTYTVDVV